MFRCARLCPCQPNTSLWAAAWPRCTSAQMEPTCTGSGPQQVSTRRHRRDTLSSWMSFTCRWVLRIPQYGLSCTVFLHRCLIVAWFFFSLSSPMAQTQTGLCVADILQERVILTRKEGESSKCLNELLLSRMSRFRASHSATLAALTGSAITNTVKEEQSGNGRKL